MIFSNKKLILRIGAGILAFVGIVLLTMVFYPLLSYKVTANRKFPSLLSPVDNLNADNLQQPTVSKDTGNLSQSGEAVDYTKASNWFAGDSADKFSQSNVSYYSISIPKLGINNATVAIGGEDLTKYVIQYPGTALPGYRGNVVIFGHSTLPSFYDPTDYVSIFSTLPHLDAGDDIKLYYDGVEYTYRVENMLEVSPTDIQILEQNVSDSFVSLITCTPPGDPRKPKRLIVRARIVPVEAIRNESNWN